MVESEEAVDKIPDLGVLQLRFMMTATDPTAPEAASIKQKLLATVERDKMATVYAAVCEQFHWPADTELQHRMRTDTERTLGELDAKIKDAEENLGENEIREALLARSNFLARIGEKDKAVAAYDQTMLKTVALGQKLDIAFTMVRIGFFHGDDKLVAQSIEKASTLLEQGADWDRKNRLKCYKGVQALIHRNFPEAARQFLDTISTFSAYELFDYPTLVQYTVVTAVATLPRADIKQKLIECPEVLSSISQLPHLKQLAWSLYNCEYGAFLVGLLQTMEEMRRDWLLAPHTLYFCREMRVRAYAQHLESYRSVQLSSMAAVFGVSPEFMDSELSRFIALGRLHCIIDKVGGIVDTNRPDERNALYQSTIKQGDNLLNRMHKLSRIVVS
eukprot:TRINITY_DN17185_c0_g1_i1.p1 TRINITY_DN17185_c0_g1~~TRINITY_DN17185_c0_g1_i1.p1  ORF type:complete len:407 (-),score=137.47 TRINITY_DN17185_c0_g1_i1:122-1288(-)